MMNGMGMGGDDGLVIGYHLVCACAHGFEPHSPHMVTTGGISRCKVCPGRKFPCSCTFGVGIVPLKKQLQPCCQGCTRVSEEIPPLSRNQMATK